MKRCSYSDKIEAYHDGELDAPGRLEVERHLAECAACAEELSELRGLSEAFAAVPDVHLSQMGRHRLRGRIDQVMTGGLMRTAWMLSGLAASVLVVGSLWLARAEQSPQAAPPWVEVAAVTAPLSRDSTTPAAEWYLAGAFSRAEEMP